MGIPFADILSSPYTKSFNIWQTRFTTENRARLCIIMDVLFSKIDVVDTTHLRKFGTQTDLLPHSHCCLLDLPFVKSAVVRIVPCAYSLRVAIPLEAQSDPNNGCAEVYS